MGFKFLTLYKIITPCYKIVPMLEGRYNLVTTIAIIIKPTLNGKDLCPIRFAGCGCQSLLLLATLYQNSSYNLCSNSKLSIEVLAIT